MSEKLSAPNSSNPAPEGWGDFRDDPDLPKWNDSESSASEKSDNSAYTKQENETATNRTPGDTISPDADASNNPFDAVGTLDDGVDITEPDYNNAKAEAIQRELDQEAGLAEDDFIDVTSLEDLETFEALDDAERQQAAEIADYYERNPEELDADFSQDDYQPKAS